jgi:hypothetical protein
MRGTTGDTLTHSITQSKQLQHLHSSAPPRPGTPCGPMQYRQYVLAIAYTQPLTSPIPPICACRVGPLTGCVLSCYRWWSVYMCVLTVKPVLSTSARCYTRGPAHHNQAPDLRPCNPPGLALQVPSSPAGTASAGPRCKNTHSRDATAPPSSRTTPAKEPISSAGPGQGVGLPCMHCARGCTQAPAPAAAPLPAASAQAAYSSCCSRQLTALPGSPMPSAGDGLQGA